MHQRFTVRRVPFILIHRGHMPSYVFISVLLSPHQAFALGAGYPKECLTHTRDKLLSRRNVAAWLSSMFDAHWPFQGASC